MAVVPYHPFSTMTHGLLKVAMIQLYVLFGLAA
jgi:hypothetical protein